MLHLAQVGFFKPVIGKLNDAGEPTSRYLRASGLSRFDLSKARNYVPLASLCSFLGAVERRHGARVYLEEFADTVTLAKIPDFTDLILHSPDILAA